MAIKQKGYTPALDTLNSNISVFCCPREIRNNNETPLNSHFVATMGVPMGYVVNFPWSFHGKKMLINHVIWK